MREEEITSLRSRVLSPEALGRNLRNARRNIGMSVAEVRSRLAFIIESDNAIYLWEEGRRLPKGDTLMIVLQIYHLNMLDFFTTEIPDLTQETKAG